MLQLFLPLQSLTDIAPKPAIATCGLAQEQLGIALDLALKVV